MHRSPPTANYMNSTRTIEELLGQQYDILGHGDIKDEKYTEIRILSNGTSFFCKNKEEFIRTAKEYCKSDAYVGINPRRRNGGRAIDVSHVSCLVIDIDPVREKGLASTPEQHKEALDVGRKIHADFEGTSVVSSGSGCHVYFPISPVPVTNVLELTKSLSAWMDAVRRNYETATIKIDSIHDIPRIIRLWGSHNTRSNRSCAPITEVPTGRLSYSFQQTPKVEEKSGVVLTELEDRFERLRKSNKRLDILTRGPAIPGSRSEADFEFIAILNRAGFTEGQINELAHHCKSGKLSTEDRTSDIRRVCSKDLSDSNKDEPRPNKIVEKPRTLSGDSIPYLSALRERRTGLLSGIGPFDRMVSGFRNQKLYIFAARPNEGKTTLATQLLVNIAEQGKTCLFFPTEVGAEPIWDKIVSMKTGINLKKFQNGNFTAEEFRVIDEAVPRSKHLPIMVVEDFGLTVEKIEDGIRKFAPQVVCVDFFQALKWSDAESVGEKSNVVRKFKEMAGDYELPFILMSQLNRNDQGANLKQLKGTGTLEELGDVITFIQTVDKLQYPTPVDLVVMKSKYSATGLVKTLFHRSQCRFEAVEHQEEN